MCPRAKACQQNSTLGYVSGLFDFCRALCADGFGHSSIQLNFIYILIKGVKQLSGEELNFACFHQFIWSNTCWVRLLVSMLTSAL